MATIGSLAYKVIMHTADFQKGSIATRRELRAGQTLFQQTRTPAEQYGHAVDNLGKLLEKGAIDQSTYDRSLKAIRAELPQVKQAEQERAEAMRRGQAIMRANETSAERYKRELRELNQLLRVGAIDKGTYTRATGKLHSQMLATVPGFGRFNGLLTAGHPAIAAAAVAIGGLALAQRTLQAVVSTTTQNIRQQLGAIDELAKNARKLGLSVNDLQGIRMAAAEGSGFSDQQTDMALQRMTRRIAEAANGTGEARSALRELGLDARRLADAGPAQAMREIADAIAQVENPADRLRIAFKLFDSEGAALVNTLAGGSDVFDRTQQFLEQMGLALTEQDVAAVEAANDAWGRFTMSLDGVWQRAAVQVAPALQSLANDLTTLLAEGSQTRETLDTLFSSLPPLIQAASAAMHLFLAQLQDAQRTTTQLVEGTARLADLATLGQVDFLGHYSDSLNQSAARLGQSSAEHYRTAFERAMGETGASPVLDVAMTVSAGLIDLEALDESQRRVDELMQRGAALTEQFLTPLQRYQQEIAGLQELLEAGAISQEVWEQATRRAQQTLNAPAVEAARKQAAEREAAAKQQAAEAERKQQDMMRRGQSLVDQYRTAQEKYNDRIAELRELLNGGAIDLATFGQAAADARKELERPVTDPLGITQAGTQAFATRITQALADAERRPNAIAPPPIPVVPPPQNPERPATPDQAARDAANDRHEKTVEDILRDIRDNTGLQPINKTVEAF